LLVQLDMPHPYCNNPEGALNCAGAESKESRKEIVMCTWNREILNGLGMPHEFEMPHEFGMPQGRGMPHEFGMPQGRGMPHEFGMPYGFGMPHP
jgi:hypothetical protein